MVLPRSTQTAENFLWGRARFLEEARTLARLEAAPGIVTVHDFLEANGTAYMVMTLVRGETLEARLKRDRACRSRRSSSCSIPCSTAGTGARARASCIGDIKPRQHPARQFRPADPDRFRRFARGAAGRTRHDRSLTPGYAAFEQSTSAGRPWTDIYALAAAATALRRAAAAGRDRMIGDGWCRRQSRQGPLCAQPGGDRAGQLEADRPAAGHRRLAARAVRTGLRRRRMGHDADA
jgi:hypothetical protein